MDVITRLFSGIASRARILYYRSRGMRITGRVWLRDIEVQGSPRSVVLENGAALDRGVILLSTDAATEIRIGASCYVNRHTMIDAALLVSIGAETMIGPFCYITDHDHTFGADIAPSTGALVSCATSIGSRCWLGAHVTVLKGVSIGAGTVVGAGSVVTRSLPPSVVAAGNPARVLRETTS
ncbi:acyltransferase [Verrucomicrobiota bacterium sgz303538]